MHYYRYAGEKLLHPMASETVPMKAPAHRLTVPGAARAICRAGGGGGDLREVPCAPHAEVSGRARGPGGRVRRSAENRPAVL